MACFIIGAGSFYGLPVPVRDTDTVIAADGGWRVCRELSLTPSLLVADFDSLDTVPEFDHILRLPVEKDDTDTMAAVRWAVSEGFAEIRLYCALGGRLDHLLGNIQSLAFACRHGAKASLYGREARLHLISNSAIALPPCEGYSLSVLALTDRVENVCITGVKYPLHGALVTNSFPIGVSNEWEDTAHISCGAGILLVINAKK